MPALVPKPLLLSASVTSPQNLLTACISPMLSSYLLPSAQWGAWGAWGSWACDSLHWEGQLGQPSPGSEPSGRGPGPWSSTVVVCSSLPDFHAGLSASVKAGMGSC